MGIENNFVCQICAAHIYVEIDYQRTGSTEKQAAYCPNCGENALKLKEG